MARCLVTGSAGFVGSHLSKLLTQEGHVVIGHDRATGGPDLIDRDAMFQGVAEASPDMVFHLAGQSHVPTSWEDPIGTLRSNAEGTQNLLDAAAEGEARVVIVTSAEVYGQVEPTDLPITENQQLRPMTPYAASKVAADTIGLQAFLGRGQHVVRARAFNHVGPGQRSTFVAAGLARRIAEAERDKQHTIVAGNLESRRDFTDVRDVVRAYLRLAESGLAGEAYNVCSGLDRSIAELAAGLLASASIPIELGLDPHLARQVDVPVMRGDNTKIAATTGWSPTIPMEQTLSDVLDDARERIRR